MTQDLERLLEAQRALLAPFDPAALDAWVQTACAAVRTVASCDRALFFLPALAPPPGSEAGSPRGGLRVWMEDPARSAAAPPSGRWDEAPPWSGPLLRTARELRRGAGRGVFHERDLLGGDAPEDRLLRREARRPHRHLMGLAVEAPGGQEYAVVAAYEHPDAPGFCDETLLCLRLLYPAFESFAQAHARFGDEARVLALAAAVDAFELPLLLTDADGGELHWNRALVRLLERERVEDRLLEVIHGWARYLAQLRKARSEEAARALVPPPRLVLTSQGRYRVYGVPLGPALLGQDGALITLQRVGLPLPTLATLRERFALTPREAEVTLLLARGHTDREIAEALTVSYSTARHHAEHALQKLDVRSRAGVAARLWETPPPGHDGPERT
jgi:DNA-binding CsgD family transcriptional regulator